MDPLHEFHFYAQLPCDLQHRIVAGDPKDIRLGRQLNQDLRRRLKYDKIKTDLSLPITRIEVVHYLETLPPTFIISRKIEDGDMAFYHTDSYRLCYDEYFHELGIIYSIDGDEKSLMNDDSTGQHMFYSPKVLLQNNAFDSQAVFYDLLTIYFILTRRLLEIGVEDLIERRTLAVEETIRYLQDVVRNYNDDLIPTIFSYLLLNSRLMGIRTTEESKYLSSILDSRLDLLDDDAIMPNLHLMAERLYNALISRIPLLHEY
ncbi:Hypothetical protein POVR1_LOCUS193 [uncultured virus]|nr:Hypothetical protein POVR1_LOCUS193 [uncultured virus]